MRKAILCLSVILCLNLLAPHLPGADNQLTDAEQAAGWRLLFNGRDATGWKCNNGREPADTVVEDGALVPYKSGGYVLIYDEQFDDFVFKCDVKMPERCNSGVFFRIGDPGDPVQTGFEMQVLNSPNVSRNGWGAIYDLVAPSKNNLKPTGEWNSVVITCRGPHITIATNGEEVAKIDCDEWTEPGTRLDGSKHKFRAAIKDFPRKGYLGFQDHGAKVWYKNVKILELDE
jgi:hypothetical protein